ncbi:MAG: serine/threonine protein kinase, partial [Anaerolineae bacterium]
MVYYEQLTINSQQLTTNHLSNHPMSDLINQTLGKYKVIARLGRGGMADVYKAYNPNLQQHVAIKLLHGYPAEREIGRFEQEAAAVARLRHPNIVRIFDFDVADGLHYMVMELIDGPTLEAKLKTDSQRGQRDMGEIARIFGALASAIDYAHSRGMVHHDLKPANIMFTEDGEVVLMDFGIARIVGERSQHTATGSITGTPAYMSPEQCKGLRGDTRSDIYSLGVILYEMACGRPPFQAENVYGYIKAHIGDRPPLPSQFNPELTPPVENVILKALQKNPEARYQTAGEMAAELRAALGL